jgi:sugar-specific transcriptional regulator TrmB
MPISSNKALILKRFKEIGLSSNEVKGYLTLLERRTLTVPEVSKLAGVPLPNAYRALESLMSKGLCIAKPGATKKYTASDPSLLEDKLLKELDGATQIELENLRKKEQQTLEKAQGAKQDIRAIIQELKPQYEKSQKETSPLDFIEVIKDPLQVHKRFMQLVTHAKEEILAFTKPPYSGPRKRLEEQSEPQKKVLRQGIRIRNIYEIPTDKEEIKWRFQDIDRAVKDGEEARVMKELPMKMVILDRKTVMLALADPVSKETSLTTQIVEHRDLANSLRILFDTLWKQAEDYHVLEDLRR